MVHVCCFRRLCLLYAIFLGDYIVSPHTRPACPRGGSPICRMRAPPRAKFAKVLNFMLMIQPFYQL